MLTEPGVVWFSVCSVLFSSVAATAEDVRSAGVEVFEAVAVAVCRNGQGQAGFLLDRGTGSG